MKIISEFRESFFLTAGNWLPRARWSDRIRSRLFRLAGMKIEQPCRIWGPIVVRPIGSASNVHIGSGTFINTETRFGANATITIGNNVAIGPRVSLETTGHGLVHVLGKGRGTFGKPIRIGDEAWLGAGVIVAPGVTIGKGAVIAAGAVVVRDVEEWTVCAGVPAKTVRYIDPNEEQSEHAR